ncbi:MAG: polysaccharide biosynthesis C-terminal domain-containing protein, partial [bacterium]|nr:polysaccharide biosynthesis C-terminal domain-containing protein [bacterium]
VNNAIQAILLYIFAFRICKISFAYDWKLWKRILFRSWPIALSIILNLVYLKADTIILSLYKPQSDVGLYGAAYRVFEVLMTLPYMFMGVALASFARAWSSGDHATFRRYFQKSFDFMAIITLPIVVGTLFLAHPIMLLVAGDDFSPSGDILMVLIIASGFVFFGTLFGHLINVIHEQRRMLIGYVCGAVVGLTGYFIFIPTYSYWGAAWMTIFAEALVASIGFWVFYKKTHIFPSFSIVFRSAGATLCMALVLFFTSSFHLFITLLLGSLSYVVFLILFGGVPKEVLSLFLGKKVLK